MQRSEVEKFVKSFIEVIWEKHEYDKLNQFYHADLEAYFNADKVDYGTLENKLKSLCEHMQGLKIETRDLLIEDDSFALHVLQKWNFGEKEHTIATILIAHLKDGKMYECWLKTEPPFKCC